MTTTFNEDKVRRDAIGQFANKDAKRDEAELINLGDENSRSQRAQELISNGYVAPVASVSTIDPNRVGIIEREQWWGGNFINAEYNADDGSYPQMPDDYTPKMTGGLAMSGHRRTHRMRYKGEDVTLRMPSATSIKAYATDEGGTFDVPLGIETPEGTRQGWVRVTRGENGHWSTQALGFGDKDAPYVSESVRSVLESRHPSTALNGVSVLSAHRERQAREGVESKERDSWISHIGYDETSQTAFVRMRSGKTKGGEETTYAYGNVTPMEYRQVEESSSLGAAYNRHIKHKEGHTSSRASQCPKCARFMSANAGHVCPTPKTPRRPEPIGQNEAALERARRAVGHMPAPEPVQHNTSPTQPDVKQWARREWENASRNGTLEGKTSVSSYGPNVPRAFTMQDGVVDVVAKYADQKHVPEHYRPAIGNKVAYSNGDTGLMNFSGLGGQDAARMRDHLPREILAERSVDGAPTNGAILDAVAKSGGRMETLGWMVPPSRADESVRMQGVLVYSETDDPMMAKLEASAMGLSAQGVKPPTECRKVDTPWRPGESAWLMSW